MSLRKDLQLGWRILNGNDTILVYHTYISDIFSRFYYQHDEARLGTCTLPIHGCLHVAKDLHMCGPAWAHWTFYVERYCLFLKTGLRSRRHPWSGLSRVVLFTAYLSQLSFKFDLKDELDDLNLARRGDEVLKNESMFDNCKSF